MELLCAIPKSFVGTKSWRWSAVLLVAATTGCTTIGRQETVAAAPRWWQPDQPASTSGPQYASLADTNAEDTPPMAVPGPLRGADAQRTHAPPADPDNSLNRRRGRQLAQFAVPQAPADGGQAPTSLPPRQLQFEYVLGTEAEVEYLKDLDLDKALIDDSLVVAPTVFGSITYRPTDWLETRAELTLERAVDIRVENETLLPDGTVQPRERKTGSLLFDQLYAKVSPPAAPVEFTFGRRNFEDQRLWLYDTALDGAILNVKAGDFNVEASLTRENGVDLDLLTSAAKSRINNYIVYGEYRGIADNRLAAYWMLFDDRKQRDGEPQHYGVRAIGRPSDPFNYWADLGFVGGRDEDGLDLSGWGFDVGGTYRFLETPLQPSVSLGYAYGSGDSNANDGNNDSFRQTGLQSNEGRFGGVTQFVTYGETLAPELSNIKIITAGASMRPAPGMFVDLVYHNYRFDEIAQEVRGSNLTALVNQVAGQESKDLGNEVDLILGFRDLFGLRGLGFEVRAGMFFPGAAFDREAGGSIDEADKAVSALFITFF